MTTPFAYSETELARDARLLRALGWTRLARVNTMQWFGIPPGADHNIPQACPRFHSDHNAKHTLLVWINSQTRWMWLLEAFAKAEKLEWCPDNWDILNKLIALADPAAVAIAADEALREAGAYKEGE